MTAFFSSAIALISPRVFSSIERISAISFSNSAIRAADAFKDSASLLANSSRSVSR